MDYNKLIVCFQDTLKISEDELWDVTREAIQNTRVFKEDIASEIKIAYKDSMKALNDAEVKVEIDTTFHSARNYLKDGKVAVLNFANPKYPGGGVQNGAKAQEECLCRSSNLYQCLKDEKVFEDYYFYHAKRGGNWFTDRMIYSLGITVFKDDSPVPVLMLENEWFQVDVITCAAPYLGGSIIIEGNELKQIFVKRIKNILDAAIINQVQTIILGAFGCGAFKNPPEVVAQAFYEVIYEMGYKKYFKRIVFAIKPSGPYCKNIEAFSKRFDMKMMEEQNQKDKDKKISFWEKCRKLIGK